MEVDLGRKLHFPEAVLSTTLRPDIIMWSPGGKKIILVELTVPWEEGCEEAAERKKGKYQQLVQDCRDKGWTTRLMTVEVCCRGFPAQSVWNLLMKVGLRGHVVSLLFLTDHTLSSVSLVTSLYSSSSHYLTRFTTRAPSGAVSHYMYYSKQLL